jgi:hypothetical protein
VGELLGRDDKTFSHKDKFISNSYKINCGSFSQVSKCSCSTLLCSPFNRFFSFMIRLFLEVLLNVIRVQPVLYMGAVGFSLEDRDSFVANHVRDCDGLRGEMGECGVFFGKGNGDLLEPISRMQEQVSVYCVHEVGLLQAVRSDDEIGIEARGK